MSATYVGRGYVTPNATACPGYVCALNGPCGGNACGAAACGAVSCGLDACGTAACATNACLLNFCAADACWVNLTPLPGPFEAPGSKV
ncbi:Cys-every-fifth RiPP peptide CefA [Paenibacillus donghaensis]|uniref:Uncharacterized protein n=1 Tax=Paenibacillus donghaensis TaxID=414771 RepID=A0A2Z2KGZ1_9BACL|nr:hypothetical protein B9T62_34995 [Paenibacillus donghaensis]